MTIFARRPSRSTWFAFAVVGIVSAVMLGAVGAIHLLRGVPIVNLTADPTAVAGVDPYIGFLSQAGIFLWAATGAICCFSAALLWRRPEDRRWAVFLLLSGLATLWLGIDDVFLLHERVLPARGISQELVLGSYLVGMLAYLAVYARRILQTAFGPLVLALFAFSVSVAWDGLHPTEFPLRLLEDGSKFVGLVSWLAYFSQVAFRLVTRGVTAPGR